MSCRIMPKRIWYLSLSSSSSLHSGNFSRWNGPRWQIVIGLGAGKDASTMGSMTTNEQGSFVYLCCSNTRYYHDVKHCWFDGNFQEVAEVVVVIAAIE
ncbi:hypothetical protein ZWY2020_024179 [Hordeum vulgare]|nr:hypothetical protein ZWY2020_024179 [Hordeum vulgare]